MFVILASLWEEIILLQPKNYYLVETAVVLEGMCLQYETDNKPKTFKQKLKFKETDPK